VNPLAPGNQCIDGGQLVRVSPPSSFLLKGATPAALRYPFTTATGLSLATFFPIPAESTTSTTFATSL